MAVCIVLFLILMLAAFTERRWFWRLEHTKLLKSRLEEIDAQIVDYPSIAGKQNTIEILRNYQNTGDKIVVVHLLSRMASDFESRIRNGILRGAVMPIIVIVFIYSSEQAGSFFADTSVAQHSTAKSDKGAKIEAKPSSALATTNGAFGLGARMAVFIGTSIGLFLFMIECLYLYHQLTDLIERYSRVLRSTNPASAATAPTL